MKTTLCLLLIVILCTLKANAVNNVTACINPVTPPPAGTNASACYDRFLVTLNLNVVAGSPNCPLTFRCPAGVDIDQASLLYGGSSVQPAWITLVNVTNPLSNVDQLNVNYSVAASNNISITFYVSMTGCEVYTASSYIFITSLTCGTVSILPNCNQCNGNPNQMCLQIDRPHILLDFDASHLPGALPPGSSAHNDGTFLKFDEVDKYYKLIPTEGSTDFFTLDINIEPDVDVLSIEAVYDNGGNRYTIASSTIPGGTTEHLVFYHGTAPTLPVGYVAVPILNCTNDLLDHLHFNPASVTNNYILIKEKIKVRKVLNCTDDPFNNSPTQYNLGVHCDEQYNSVPCSQDQKNLNVDGVQKEGDFSIGIRRGATYSSTFPALAICATTVNTNGNTNTVDYSAIITNGFTNNPVGYTPATGAGTVEITGITIQINPKYFSFTGVKIGSLPVNYTLNPLIPLPGDVSQSITISALDLAAALQNNPNAGGSGLANELSSLNNNHFNDGNAGYVFLPEGQFFYVTLTGMQLKCSPLQACAQTPFTLTANTGSPYFNLTYKSMCHMGLVPVPPPVTKLFDIGWLVANTFSGYTFGVTDNSDVYPANPVANLTYSYFNTSASAAINPWKLFQINTGVPADIIDCPNLYYYASIIIPPIYSFSGPVTVINSSTGATIGNVTPVAGPNPNEYIIDWTPLTGLPAIPGVTLTIPVTINCPVGNDWGFNNFPLEFRANCDNGCPTCYRTYGCYTIDLFRHCHGPCTSLVDTKNFTFNRNTFGWSTQAAYEAAPTVPDLTLGSNPQPQLDRFYECDKITASSTLGNTYVLTSGSRLNFDINYDPGDYGTQVNIFDFVSGSFTVTPVIPGAANCTIPVFTVPISAGDVFYQYISGGNANSPQPGIIKLQAPLNFTVPNVTGAGCPPNLHLNVLLETYPCHIDFNAVFKVTDHNLPLLAGSYYPLQGIQGGFTYTDGGGEHNCCDSYTDESTFFKIIPQVESEALVGPGWANQDMGFPYASSQCVLRYLLYTNVAGGFPGGDDFDHEFRPAFDWPNSMQFTPAAGLTLTNARLYSTASSFPPYANWFAAPHTGNINFANLHNVTPAYQAIDKNNRTRQAFVLQFNRNCPNNANQSILVSNLNIIKNAYNVDASCQSSLLTNPHTLTYSPAPPEIYNISLITSPLSPLIATTNPTNVPRISLTFTHTGAGTGIDGGWVYFTGPAGCTFNLYQHNSNIPIPQLFNNLFNLGSLAHSTTADLQVQYPCSGTNGLYNPVTITAHFGNNCNGVTSFPPVNPLCQEWTKNIVIEPQSSNLSLNASGPSGTITSCNAIPIDVYVSSTAADVLNATLTVTPPPGFVFDHGYVQTTAHPVTAGPSWNINNILSTVFGEPHFMNGSTNNPLHFVFYYLPTCVATANTYYFNYSLSGYSLCNEFIQEVSSPVSINFAPPTVCNLPVAAIISAVPNPVCSGGSSILTVSGAGVGGTYHWGPPVNFTTSSTTLNVTPLVSTTYSAQAINSYGCTSLNTATIVVNVVPPPNPVISGPTSLCIGSTVVLTSSYSTGNQWYLNGVLIPGAVNQTYSAPSAGIYTVVVTLSGCSGTSNQLVVTANSCCTYAAVLTQTIINSYINSGAALGGNWNLNSNVTLAPFGGGNSFTLSGANIAIAPNVRITVLSNFSFNVNSSRLFACGDMWDGIYLGYVGGNPITVNNVVNVSNSQINHAQFAIYTDNDHQSIFRIANSLFDQNHVDVHAYYGGSYGYNSSIHNTVFSCSQTLRPPYLGSNTFAHLDYMTHQMNVGAPGTQNQFITGTYGIKVNGSSVITSYSNQFSNMTYGMYASNGATTTLKTLNSINNCTYGDYGYSKCNVYVEDNNTFNSCTIGVMTNVATNTYVWGNSSGTGVSNNFFKCIYGVYALQTGKDIYVQDNKFFDTKLIGILSLLNISAVQKITGNSIIKGSSAYSLSIGIYLINNTNPSNAQNVFVEYNTVLNYPLGIYSTNNPNSLYHENSITLPTNYGSLMMEGLYLSGSNTSELRRNHVYGDPGSSNLFDQKSSAIHILNSQSVRVLCNDVQLTYKGINWDGSTSSPSMIGNTMTDCSRELNLDHNPNGLGAQGFVFNIPPWFGPWDITFDNKWEWSGTYGTLEETYANNNSNSANTTSFLVKDPNACAPPPHYQPTINNADIGNGGIPCVITTTYNPFWGCPDICDLGIIAARQPYEDEREKEEAIRIAGTNSHDESMEGSEWLSKSYLYKLLKDKPDLLTEPALETAKIELDQTPVKGFTDLDDTLITNTDTLYGTVEVDSTINVDSLARVLAQQESDLNLSISASKQIEMNNQDVNRIYLNTVAVGNNKFSADELSRLQGVASQCPYKGGNAVFMARGMLLVTNLSLTDYSHACDKPEKRQKKTAPESVDFNIYPNPNDGLFTISYSVPENQNGYVSICDLTGRELKFIKLDRERKNIALDLSSFGNGSYLCKEYINGVMQRCTMFVINK